MGVPVPKNTKQCPVIFDGEPTGQTAVLDFKGLKKDDQASILQALVRAKGLKFKKIRENGRQIVLEYTWTSPGTIMSFLRELMRGFGYTPVQSATA
jgi:hypothetical protein